MYGFAKKMKQLFFAFLILFFSLHFSYAIGIGPQIEITNGFSDGDSVLAAGAACSIKADNFPGVMAVCTDFDFARNKFSAATTFDYWTFKSKLSDFCSFFMGQGASIGFEADRSRIDFAFGARLVTGFSWILYDGFLEYFVQCAIQPEYSTANEFAMKVPLNVGTRLYF